MIFKAFFFAGGGDYLLRILIYYFYIEFYGILNYMDTEKIFKKS